MATTLPVPIEFRLPDGWQPAPPDEVGAPGVAFVALHPASRDDFTANITISGELRPDDASLASIADESVDRLSQGAVVSVANRTEVGSAEVPGLTQVLNVSTSIAGKARDLVQCQVYLSVQDAEEPARRAIVELVLTATPNQLNTVVGDFQQFVSTVRPPEQAGTNGNGQT